MNLSKKPIQLIAIILVAALVAGICIPAGQVFAQEDFKQVKKVRYANSKTWLYSIPGEPGQKSEKIKKSQKVSVTGESADGWSRVIYSKKTHYIQSKYLSKDNGYLVVIDAGHQKKGNSKKEPIGPGAKAKKPKVSSGATGRYTKTPEYKLTLIMAKKLKKELQARGYKVKMIRTKHKVNLSNSKRAKIANKAKADVFIRIHANGASSSSAKGALTIAPTKKNKYCKKVVKPSQKLSKAMLSEFCKATGAKNRGVMYTNTMSGINWSKVPVTIVEMGFLSNKSEDKKMNKSKKYQKKMTKGMANGIDRYLKRI